MSKKSSAFDQMKYEVANEMGVQLNHGYNGDKTARENGSTVSYTHLTLPTNSLV